MIGGYRLPACSTCPRRSTAAWPPASPGPRGPSPRSESIWPGPGDGRPWSPRESTPGRPHFNSIPGCLAGVFLSRLISGRGELAVGRYAVHFRDEGEITLRQASDVVSRHLDPHVPEA